MIATAPALRGRDSFAMFSLFFCLLALKQDSKQQQAMGNSYHERRNPCDSMYFDMLASVVKQPHQHCRGILNDGAVRNPEKKKR